MSNLENIIDLSSSEDVICISDEENQGQNDVPIIETDFCVPVSDQSRRDDKKFSGSGADRNFLGKLNPEFEKNLKLVLKENIEKVNI